MGEKSKRRGRPQGASRYELRDREALKRMYELVEAGMPSLAAAQQIHREMKLDGNDPVERLRAKFRRRRIDAANSTAHTSAQTPERRPALGLLTPVEHARILEGAKLAREQFRVLKQMGITADHIRQNIEEVARHRSFLKRMGFKDPWSDEDESR